jgi:hypothetical protein
MSWHADDTELDAYGAGEVHGARAHSIEQHLASCDQCRRRHGARFDRGRMTMVWSEVVDELDRPPTPVIERLLRLVGVREATARLIATTPSMRSSWILGVMATLAFCVIGGGVFDTGTPALFLVVAPLVPVAMVAAAFGTRFDPTAELTQSTPVSNFRLLLLRVAAVLVGTIPLVLAAELLLDTPGPGSARWLLPSLAMVAATLVLSTRFEPTTAAGVVCATWIALLTLATIPEGATRAGEAVSGFVAFDPIGQVVSAAVVVAGAMWVAHERDAIEVRRIF